MERVDRRPEVGARQPLIHPRRIRKPVGNHHLPGGEVTTGLASMVILGAGVLTSIFQKRIEDRLRECQQKTN